VGGGFDHEVVLPAGERHKNWESVDAIVDAALRAGLGRDGTIVGCGGGVVTDVAAFAASIFMRGCRVVLVPTTLLAMVDAAFGGKTGIDFGNYKNMVGSFHPAYELRIAVGFLSSLPQRDFRSGLAEVLKHSLLVRSGLRTQLQSRRDAILSVDLSLLEEIVADALSVKARIVEQDFLENGIRAHLNLGHTFGHALESVTGFHDFTHGEGVAWGIDKAMRTGVRLGATDPSYAAEVRSLLDSYGFSLDNLPDRASMLVEAMRQDKKKRAGHVRFVLQRGWGETYVAPVDDEIILSVLRE
jgi:3-dehydroquinate synthase